MQQIALAWAGVFVIFSLGFVTGLLPRQHLLTFVLVYWIASIALAVVNFIMVPNRKRAAARRPVIFLLGMFLFVLAAFSGRGNMQLEGLFMGLMIGLAYPPILHYAIAKIIGPLGFGRIWCGWACWFAGVFDQLPYKRSRGRLPGRWGWVRFIHFALVFVGVMGFWFGFGYRDFAFGLTAIYWFLLSVLMYYLSGLILAVALRDNRAFCKYLCPISTLLKSGARYSLLKVDGDAAKCDECQACTMLCPMDVDVPKYIKADTRVLSTECTLCMACVNACPTHALRFSLGVDVGGVEHLRQRARNHDFEQLRGLRLRRLLPGGTRLPKDLKF